MPHGCLLALLGNASGVVPYSKGVPVGGAGTTDRALMASVPAPFLTGCEKEETLCSCGCGISQLPNICPIENIASRANCPSDQTLHGPNRTVQRPVPLPFSQREQGPKASYGCKKCWGCEVATRYGFSFDRCVIVVVLKVVFII